MTLSSQVVLAHEDEEAVECQETDHTPIGVGGGEEVQEETRVLEVWHYGRVEVHQCLPQQTWGELGGEGGREGGMCACGWVGE